MEKGRRKGQKTVGEVKNVGKVEGKARRKEGKKEKEVEEV